MFYIYGLRVKGDSEFRYIGCTSDPSTRILIHGSERKVKAKYEWVQQNRGNVEMVILKEVPDRYDAAVEESRAIRKYRRDGHRLLNTMKHAAPVRAISDETKARLCKPKRRKMSKERSAAALREWSERNS